MSLKSDVVALLTAKKDEKVAAVAAEFDSLIGQVDAMPEPTSDEQVALLQQQLADSQAQVAAVQAAFDADEVLDEAAMAEEKAKEAQLQAKLDRIKAALEA